MTYANGRMFGVAIGVAVGLIICLFLFRYINKDKNLKTKYDEMQEIVRGRGFKYGFFAILIYEGIMTVLSFGDFRIPIEQPTIHFLGIVIGVVVQAGYCIWNDAYMGLNTNGTRFAVVMIVVALVNFLVAFGAFRSGEMIKNGQLQSPFVNFLCGMLLVVIGAEILIKKIVDGRESEV